MDLNNNNIQHYSVVYIITNREVSKFVYISYIIYNRGI